MAQIHRPPLETLLALADGYFPQVDTSIPNRELLTRILHISGLTKEVVTFLKREEDEGNWPLQESDIRGYITRSCRTYGLSLPSQPLDLERWYCLVYIGSSLSEGFDCENLVGVADVKGVLDPHSNSRS